MSFLQRLKNRGIINEQVSLPPVSEETSVDKVLQLDVDVYQTEKMIVIYAQSPGVDINDISVSIEGDADIVLIEGRRVRPDHLVFSKKKDQGTYFAQECIWGNFYRRIILPESVAVDKAEAKIKNGVLILILPLLKLSEKERVRLKVKQDRKTTSGK